MSGTRLQHCTIERDADGIAWVTLDVQGEAANSLSTEVLGELETALDELDTGDRPKGVVFQSAKSGFIAGANVQELGAIENAAEADALIEKGQRVMDRIEAMTTPTVALIRGFCLGGGLELALACRYRVADRDPATRLGLPEVRLGIHPGFGGTVRLPDLIGAPAALDLMLSGRSLEGRAAQRMGLVDFALSPWQLVDATRDLIRRDPGRRRPKWWQRLAGTLPGRYALKPIMQRQVKQSARPEHYPAPYAMLDLWVHHGGEPAPRRIKAERTSLTRLIEGPTAGNLIRVFLLQDRLKREARSSDVAIPRRVHVIGAGTMGGDIAAWLALNGCRVTLFDEHDKAVASTLKRARSLFQKRLKRPERVTAALDRLTPDPGNRGVEGADIIIEAIVENLDAKTGLFRSLEPRMRDDAILATNTSSLPLEQLAEGLEQPGRLIGLHFFNPVAKMPLVEIVAGDQSDSTNLDRGQALIASADKLPLRVKSAPGFLVNRVLMPYMIKAAELYAKGTQRESLDEAAKRFGMPMGPLELADAVGLDVCVAAVDVMAEPLGLEVPQSMRSMVDGGTLGRKSGRGFYVYDKKGKPDRGRISLEPAELDRLGQDLIEPLLDEAERARDQGIVADGDLVDAGTIFGTGFAPFTGGPLHYRERQSGQGG